MADKISINLQKDEINLFELFKIIWIKKSRIALIAFISFVIGLFYYYQKPQLFEISLKIEVSPNLNFSHRYLISQVYLLLDIVLLESVLYLSLLQLYILF